MNKEIPAHIVHVLFTAKYKMINDYWETIEDENDRAVDVNAYTDDDKVWYVTEYPLEANTKTGLLETNTYRSIREFKFAGDSAEQVL